MVREHTNKLLEKIEDGYFTHEQILNEMLCFFSEDQIKDFCLNSFGNEGIYSEDETEEDETEKKRRFNKMNKDIKQKIEELQKENEIIEYFKIFGVDEKYIRHILSANSKEPTICFKFSNLKDYKSVIELLKFEFLNLYIESRGTTGIKPILKNDVITETENIKLLKSVVHVETSPLKHGNDSVKIKAYIPYKENVLNLWMELPLKEFDQDLYFYESVIDKNETENARRYNFKHEDIFMRIVIFKDLTKTRFYGGTIYHYALNETENKIIEEVFLK